MGQGGPQVVETLRGRRTPSAGPGRFRYPEQTSLLTGKPESPSLSRLELASWLGRVSIEQGFPTGILRDPGTSPGLFLQS